jgi:TolB-like protein/tetratricopeptide (TPR) repeat protein
VSFWEELRRRNVFKVGAAYLVAAWVLAQVVALIDEPLGLPDWFDTAVIVLLAVGFPIALLLAWAYEVTPEGIKKTRHVPLEQSVRQLTGQKLNYVVTGLLVLAVGLMAVDSYVLRATSPVETPPADAALADEPAGTAVVADSPVEGVLPNSIAVLLCDNFSTDPDNAFFAASLHEEMLNQLVKLRRLNVIARTSVLQYSGVERPTIQQIADELGVGSVMECSVAYGEGRIVISVQLIDGDTGLHVWSERYNREFKDVFGIQADIAMNVANVLAVEFSVEEQEALERPPTASAEAYALYLQTLSLNNLGALPEQMALLERALAFDPQFASAHRVKALFHSVATINTTGANATSAPGERERQLELARFHAARAAELDPSLAWFPGTVATFNEWRWSETLAGVENAPPTFVLDQVSVWLYSFVGDHEKAVTRARRWLELDPKNWNSYWTLGVALAYSGERDEAARVLRDGIAVAPVVPVLRSWLAYVEITRGDTAAAAAELARAEQLLAQNRQAVFLPELVYCYSRLGRRADVDRIVGEIEQLPDGTAIGTGGWAMVYLALGERAKALEQLQVALVKIENHEIDEGFWNLMNIRMNSTADPVLEEPEFVELRKRLRGK